MNTRTLALAASFATFAPMIAYAQKPPTAGPSEPTYTQIAAPDPTPAPLVASPAPTAVLFAPRVAAPQMVVATPTVAVYPTPPPAVAVSNEQTEGDVAAAPTTRPASEPRVATERGEFRFSIEAGLSLWEHDVSYDQTVFLPVGQLNGFFGWTVTNGAPGPTGRAFGLDVGFAIRIDADDTGVVTRHQLAAQLAWARIFVTLSSGVSSMQSLDGGDPSFGWSLDSTAGYRLAGAFFVGLTAGVDVWAEGGSWRRTGVTLGFAVD